MTLKDRMVKLRQDNPLFTVAGLTEITIYGDQQEREGDFLAVAAQVLKVPQEQVDEAVSFTGELSGFDIPVDPGIYAGDELPGGYVPPVGHAYAPPLDTRIAVSERVAIVGFGRVGKGMLNIFPDADIIDPDKGMGLEDRNARRCELAVVCVPTPRLADGSCDVSIVEKVVSELQSTFVLVKSTVTPGTTRRLSAQYGKRIVFSPEYMGESSYWTPSWAPSPDDPSSHGFCILGGPRNWCSSIADLMWPRLGPATRFRFMSSTEAELVKYFENAFFALKVTFANEMREVCERASVVDGTPVNYHVVREGWLDDPRVGPMHSAAFKRKRGWDGKCFPKDIAALSAFCKQIHATDASALMDAVIAINDHRRSEAS